MPRPRFSFQAILTTGYRLLATSNIREVGDHVFFYGTLMSPFNRPGRQRISSGSVWEPIAGYSRAVRVKDRILVSGTTATHGANRCVAPGDAGAQTTYILDKIAAAIGALGGSMADVVRTRIYLRDGSKWEPVARAPGRVFGEIIPAKTLIEAGNQIGDNEVEIEGEAIVEDS